MHHWTDLGESFLKMYSFAMLRSAGQKLYEIFLWCSLFRGVHYIRIKRYSTTHTRSLDGRIPSTDLPAERPVRVSSETMGHEMVA